MFFKDVIKYCENDTWYHVLNIFFPPISKGKLNSFGLVLRQNVDLLLAPPLPKRLHKLHTGNKILTYPYAVNFCENHYRKVSRRQQYP